MALNNDILSLQRTLPRSVVIDCANGAAYKVAPEALWELGADVITIGVSPDGFNINKEWSTSTDALSRKVHEVRRYRDCIRW